MRAPSPQARWLAVFSRLEMARLERLLNLAAALLAADRALTAEELRERVPGYPEEKGSFRRQFERDKDALRELGMPLQTVAIANESQSGYRVEFDEYYVKDPGLEPDELAALHLAARMVRMRGLADADLGAWKLGPGDEAVDGRHSGSDESAAQLPGGANVATVFAAIAGSRSVAFVYRGTPRRAVPRRLSFRNGHWYVAAFDVERGDDRSFRIDRFDGDATLGPETEVPPSARISSEMGRGWELGDGEPVIAHVRIDRAQAPWAVTHLGEPAVVERHLDGAVTVALSVRNRVAFRSFVLGFLDHGEVVSPPEFRASAVAWLQLVIESAGNGRHRDQ